MLGNFTDRLFSISEIAHDVTIATLALLSFFSVAFILERFIFLRRIGRQSQKLALKIKGGLQSHSLSEVEEIMNHEVRDSVEGKAFQYALKYSEKNGNHGLKEVLNSFFFLERLKLEKRLNFLATVGSNAPFIGLLGTVFGVMDAFRELADRGELSAVMLGISKALVATAIGLLVALPAVIAYNVFQKQVRHILKSFESVKDLCLVYTGGKKISKKGPS